ncbi:MAG: GAF domain-containing protein [Desulfobulbia bacterium]
MEKYTGTLVTSGVLVSFSIYIWIGGMEKANQHTYDHYIKALVDISQAITSELFLEDLFKLIVMVTARVTGVEICSLWLVDENENPPLIRLKATQSFEPDYVKDRVLGLNEGVVGYVVATRRPLTIKDVMANDRFKEKDLARKLGLVSMVSVPLNGKEGRVIGVLNCFTATPHEFSEIDINMLTAVASQAAVAIHNTELIIKTKVIEQELKSRKIIDRAKEILIRRRDLSGEEAYRWIQKKSMDTRKSMLEIAEAILLADEL